MDTAFIIFVFFLSSFIQGLTGFGAALVAIPLLAMFMDITVAVPLCVLNGLVITGYLSIQLHNHLDWKKILPMLAGYVPGIILGVIFLKNTNESLFKTLLALMLISYSLYRLFLNPDTRPVRKIWALIAGLTSGAITTAFSAGGPPVVMYTTLTGWTKNEIKATLSIYFFLGGILTALAHYVSGLTTLQVMKYTAVSFPAIIAGVSIGSLVYRKVNTGGFIRLILWLLIANGLLLLYSAVS